MFCQNCGAELRLETGFCSVCGAGAPAPRLHVDPKTTDQPGQRRTPSAQTPPASGTRAAQSSITKSQPTYQPPMPRHTPRHVAPVASLDISLPKPSPSPLLGNAPDAQPTAAPPEAVTAVPPTTPVTISFPAAEAAETPPAPPAPATNGQPSLLAWAYAPVVPPVSPFTQQTLHGYYPAGWMPPAPAQNGAQPAPPPGSYSLRLLRATTGIHIPRDIPNRIALGALAAALLSFFLPWLIIANQRTTPLSVGWPVALPMLVIIAVGLTILLPERALYLRWFLALPLMLGCFFLGSALLLFLLSSAIAANTAGASFLGVDIGFFLFIVASLALACVGYFKLVRELPLMLSGRLLLAPLPRFLQALSEQPAPTAPQPMPVVPVAPVAQTNIGSNGNAAQAISPPPAEPASTP